MTYKILIVEDSKLINDNLKKSLEADGNYIEQAFDFTTAVDLIQSHRFDYILLDLILPDGEGEMLLPYAKKADARVIVMTTDRDSFRRDRIFGFGIVDYIIKDRYYTTKDQGQGTGVGLYMSKMIIEQNMGGWLDVSNHTCGACFTIKLQHLDSKE